MKSVISWSRDSSSNLDMKSPKGGKRYNTDEADTEQLLRIILFAPLVKIIQDMVENPVARRR